MALAVRGSYHMDRILEWSQSRTQQFHWALGTAEPEASTEHGTAERENE